MNQHFVCEVKTMEQMELALSTLRGLFEEVILSKSRCNVEVIVFNGHQNIQNPVPIQFAAGETP